MNKEKIFQVYPLGESPLSKILKNRITEQAPAPVHWYNKPKVFIIAEKSFKRILSSPPRFKKLMRVIDNELPVNWVNIGVVAGRYCQINSKTWARRFLKEWVEIEIISPLPLPSFCAY